MRKGNMLSITVILFVFILQICFVCFESSDTSNQGTTLYTSNGNVKISEEQMTKLRKLDIKSMKSLYEKYKKYYEIG